MFSRFLPILALTCITGPVLADPHPVQQVQSTLKLLEQIAPQLVLDAREALNAIEIGTDPNLLEDLNARDLTLVGRDSQDSLDGTETLPPGWITGPEKL